MKKNVLIHYGFSDPFADAVKGDQVGAQEGLIHIRIQQRNGRKTLTTVQGISEDFDKKKLVKACKKVNNKALAKYVPGDTILSLIYSPGRSIF